MKHSNIRGLKSADLPFLEAIIDSSGLFPGELLEGMIGDSLVDIESHRIWLTYEADIPVALAFFAPEPMTDGAWNVYLIAVSADHRGQGIGQEIMAYIEGFLMERGERILIVETSGNDAFELTRKFYRNLGYIQEARIREFYQAGEDKVIFWKKIGQAKTQM